MEYFKIVNLDKYQTYKDRHPSWAKMFVNMLDDDKIRQLYDGERWLFVALVLLAVGCNNRVQYDVQWIYNRVAYRARGRGAYRVRLGCKKMLKIGLISLCDNNIERKKDKKERESLINNEAECKEKTELRNFVKSKLKTI